MNRLPDSLHAALLRFFITDAPDTRRTRALAAHDVDAIADFLRPHADNGTGSRRTAARHLLADLADFDATTLRDARDGAR